MLGLAPGKGVPRKIVGVAKMIDTAQQRAEHLAVIGDAADRSPAEIDAVIAALAADQAHLGAVSIGTVISERDLERGLDRLRAGVGEEHLVKAGRRDINQLRGAFERAWMTHLEGPGEIELADLLAHRLDDLRSAMAGVDAPQSRRAVEHAPPVIGRVARALRADDQARSLLIFPV